MKKLCLGFSLILICLTLNLHSACSTVLYPEDVAKTYVDEELGVRIDIPYGWEYATSGKVIEKARDTARDVAGKVLGISKEQVKKIDESESRKGILIKMNRQDAPLPAAQVTTRDLSTVQNAPASAIQHLRSFLFFISKMTYVKMVEEANETELNGTPCAHAAYETQLVIEGSTYQTRTDVYSFLKEGRTIDVTIIQDLNTYFPSQDASDIGVVTNSIRITP